MDELEHVQMVGKDFSFSLIRDERPLTEHVHLAFPARDDATVRAFRLSLGASRGHAFVLNARDVMNAATPA